ncbi:MAG: anti-sigma factor antagonist [Lachnospiraceae bacterium]|nr:anti-sigma factor antagonist [Lachnospiraceae bacterium]
MNQVQCEVAGESLVIHLPEELDDHSSRDLRRQVEECLQGSRIRRLVFDYSRTRFMDSAGVGAVLGTYKLFREREGEVAVCGAGRRVRRLLEMAGIPRLARMCSTLEEALNPPADGAGERRPDEERER